MSSWNPKKSDHRGHWKSDGGGDVRNPRHKRRVWKSARRSRGFGRSAPTPKNEPPLSKKWREKVESRDVKLREIVVPDNHREPNDENVARLAESIKDRGFFLHPIVVRPTSGWGRQFELVSGAQCLKAAQLARLTAVPCLIVEISKREAEILAIEENLFRHDLTMLERAEQLAQWGKIAKLPSSDRPRAPRRRHRVRDRLRPRDLGSLRACRGGP